ncbi:Na+/H+ antiporter subunit D [Corynebacterium bouchesdurhonense]|uniref:Na+/H+ antiporter subunit D n=1 Tax=Corynebacterium bouchesdurhonense TaxID=1720192 RepID=UPI00098F692C|nr:Na+/H+ antiporter subunit D [Corynebacterium bouchesdurhonense]
MKDSLMPFADAALGAMPYLTVMPLVLPALAAGLIFLVPRTWAQRTIALVTLFALAVIAATMIITVDVHGIQTVQMGGWEAPIGITLVADRLSTIMLFVSSLVLFAVQWYGISQGVRDGGDDEPVAVFLPTYMLLTMGVNLSFLAGDMFNLYVGFEVFLVASYVLLTLGASPERVRSGIGYVMVSVASSMIFLFALGMIYASVGTVNMAQVGIRMEEIPSGTRAAIFATLLVAFGIKAAVFPLDAWLPDSYPTAASLVTAVFAGLLTKVGVYAIIRMRTVVFIDGALDGMLMWVALFTMIVGIMGALAQNDTKRLISFTLVSHIGYMLFGVALGSKAGLSGAIFYAVHHVLVQTSLFLVVGLIERQAGSAQLRGLGSLLYTAPLIAVLYFVPAMNLGGIPPLSGFLGKVMLIQAGAESGTWLAWVLIAGAVVTSLLTLYAMVIVWTKAFMRDRSDAPEGDVVQARPSTLTETVETSTFEEREDVGRIPFGMLASTAFLVAVSTSITFVAGPLSDVTDRAAQSASDLTIYRDAVLTGDLDNPTRDTDAFADVHEGGGGYDSLDHRRTRGDEQAVDNSAVSTQDAPTPVADSGGNAK